MNIPNQLINALKNNQCAIFIGSGLSSRLFTKLGKQYPNWLNLLIDMSNWAFSHDNITKSQKILIDEIIRKSNLTVAAQILRSKMNQTEFGEFLDSIFRNDNRFDSIHNLLLELDCPFYMTTNYDCIFESAYSYKFGMPIAAYTHDQLGLINSSIAKNKKVLFKLHGTYERTNTIILTRSDYKNLYHQSAYLETLKKIFLSYTVLFVGFSYNDPDIEYVITELAHSFNSENRMHYLLIAEGNYNELEVEYMKQAERITVINYNNSDETHSGVDAFFEELLNKIEKKNSNLSSLD